MNGSIHDRGFDHPLANIPLLSPAADKSLRLHPHDRFPSPGPSSPFSKAFDSAWSARPQFNLRRHSMAASFSASPLRFLLSVIGRFLYLLIPSFFESRLRRDAPKPEKIHPTAYLDGLRGLAAFAVFICHLSYQPFWITFGFGAGEPGENAWPIQLPIIRLFYSGPPMVAMFFVISGYALSYKPIRQMRARQYDGLLVTVSSSVFRRALRLFLPCFASTLVVVVLCQLGIYERTAPMAFNNSYFRAHLEDHAWTAPTIYDQLVDWSYKMFDFVHPWDWFIYGGSVDYDRHLWTIPTEFRASMALFLTQLMVARMRTTLRLLTFVFLNYWAIHWDRWEMILFWSGALLAELDLIAQARAQSANNNPPEMHLDSSIANSSAKRGQRRDRVWRWFWLFNFICGLYLASYPDEWGHVTPGYRYLTTLIPGFYSEKLRFWQSIGAVQIVWSVNNADFLKGLFTGPVVQYLGKISFAIYLMHGPVIHTFGYAMFATIWRWTGAEPRWNFELGFFLSACLIIPGVVWAADVFWRLVDIPCVKFARWFESRCIVSS